MTEQVEGGAFVLACFAITKLVSVIRGDANKKLDIDLEKDRLALQADEQDAKQEVQLAPIWKGLIERYEARTHLLEQKLETFQAQQVEQAQKYAELVYKAKFMEQRITTLEQELALSKEKHIADSRTISRLEKALGELEAKFKLAEENNAALLAQLRNAEQALKNATDPV